LQTLIPEAVLTLFSPGALPSDEEFTRLFNRADSVVLGCGLGQSDAAYHIVEATLRLCHKPLVLDADALNLIAAHKPLRALMTVRSAPTVITPHMGEAARLSGRTIAELAADPFASASDLAEQYNAVCVLKDARTVISNGKLCYIQSHGNSGMATGGSGDCLAGLIGCLYAKTRNWEATPGFFAAAGDERKHHREREEQSKYLFHFLYLFLFPFGISNRDILYRFTAIKNTPVFAIRQGISASQNAQSSLSVFCLFCLLF
jgi:hydroxyethylthiazole kinase-like uncharacterized protein yjeF